MINCSEENRHLDGVLADKSLAENGESTALGLLTDRGACGVELGGAVGGDGSCLKKRLVN